MDMFYHLFEIFSSFSEAFIILFVSALVCNRKYTGRKHYFLIISFSLVYTVVLELANKIEIHSLLKILAALVLLTVLNRLITEADMILRLSSLITTMFFLHALYYIFVYVLTMFSQNTSVIVLMVVSRLITVAVLLLLRGIYTKANFLSRNNLRALLLISVFGYIIMYGITGMIIEESVITVQTAVLLSLFLVVLSFVITIVAISNNSRYEQEKKEAELMLMTNNLMKKNFEQTYEAQTKIRQQVHDFKNHLRTIRGMLSVDEDAKEYVDQLLCVSYEQAKYCHCGNNVIDSIINCKIAQAKLTDIQFEHRINLFHEVHISAVDICAILANQIDNAIEACEKIDENSEKLITVEIWHKEAFMFFKVTNSCANNPFNEKYELVSSKEDDGLHGYGIKNISKVVSSYGGTLKNHYEDNKFISVAMVQNNE